MGLQEQRQKMYLSIWTSSKKTQLNYLCKLPSSGISMMKTGVEGPKATVSAATLHKYW